MHVPKESMWRSTVAWSSARDLGVVLLVPDKRSDPRNELLNYRGNFGGLNIGAS